MLTPEQLKKRKAGIGSSDIAAVAGLNPWRKPIDVFLEKTGRSSSAGTIQTRVGDTVEGAIATLYQQDRPCTFLAMPEPTVVREPWEIATPDRIAVASPHDGAPIDLTHRRIVEIKMVGARVAHHWTEESPPDYVLAQVLWQLHVLKVERGDIAALIGGTDFRIYDVAFASEVAEALAEIAKTFWHENVLKDIPPAVDSSESWKRYVAERWPRSTGEIVQAPDEAEVVARRLVAAKLALVEAEACYDQAANEMKAMLQERAGFRGAGWTCTWKNTASGAPDYKALCEALGATEEQIENYRRPGARRFLFTPAKEK